MATIATPDPARDAAEVARRFFEPQLTALGLAPEAIESQSLDELNLSLRAVNDAISNPQSFGICRISATPSKTIIVSSISNSTIEVGALPILLERRRQIETRIALLQLDNEVSELEEKLVGTSESDSSDRALIEDELESKRSAKGELEARRSSEERARKFEVELQAEKTRIRQSWFERESVASVIGGMLLLLIAVALIVAMFTGTPVGEIIGNAFLLVLGYFFGQSTARKDQPAAD